MSYVFERDEYFRKHHSLNEPAAHHKPLSLTLK